MPENIFDVKLFFSKLFNIPAEWFAFPQIIFYFIIPLIALIFLWYTLLHKRIGIFRAPTVNLVISIIIAFFSSFFIRVITPTGVLIVGIAGSILLMGHFSLWRILGSIIVAILIGAIYPAIINYVTLLVP